MAFAAFLEGLSSTPPTHKMMSFETSLPGFLPGFLPGLDTFWGKFIVFFTQNSGSESNEQEMDDHLPTYQPENL